MLPDGTSARGGNTQGLQELATAGGADSDRAAPYKTEQHGAAMMVASLAWRGVWCGRFAPPVLAVCSSCAPWRASGGLGKLQPSVIPAGGCENAIPKQWLRTRCLRQCLNSLPTLELEAYNPL